MSLRPQEPIRGDVVAPSAFSLAGGQYAFRFTLNPTNSALTNNSRILFNLADPAFPYQTITNGGFLTPVSGIWSFTAGLNLDNQSTLANYRCGIGVTSTDTTSVNFSGASSFDSLTWFRAVSAWETSTVGLYNPTLTCQYYCPAGTYVKVYVGASAVGTGLRSYSWGNQACFFSGYLVSGI